jgi:ADP-Ribosyltransferase in polyvalent proteins
LAFHSNEARRDPAGAAELPSNGASGEASEAMAGAAPPAAPALKQEFRDWFGESHATNPDGSPAVAYRGEHGTPLKDQQFHSRLKSLSFSDDPVAASTYAMRPNVHKDVAQAPRVSPVHLKIEKPIIKNLDDPFIDLAHIEKELGVKEAMRIAKKFSSDIEYTGNWDENYAGKYASVADLLKRQPQELKKLYFATFKYLDDSEEVALLQKKGYDGAIHVGNGETSTSTEYRVFDLSQVRSAIKGFALGDPA